MASLLRWSKSFSGLMLVLFYIAATSNDSVYSLNPPRVTDLGDLNFVASWDPIENYTGMYNLTSEFGNKNLCYTNATSCFLGRKLLEGKPCPFISALAVRLEVDGRERDKWILNSNFRVGPPNILSPDILIDSTNITIVIQGAQTPLYYDYQEHKCRGESWEGEKSPIYMGQRESKDGVECKYNLTDAYGSRANHEIKNYLGELNENDGKLHIFLHKLKPFSNYSIVIWCTLNYEDGKSTVYNFTTKEDVPSSGPTIVNTSSKGLGCDKPDLRNITFTIQPPPEDQRHGILLFYEICYRVVSSNPDEEWHSEILNLPSPPPDSNIVTLKDTSQGDAYEVKVFANNSVGGMPSSVYQFEVLKSRPASVEALQMSPSTTQIEVSWEPSSSPCSPDYYIIRYSLLQKLACSSLETTQTEFEVNTTSTQLNNYNLVGLEPYSRYQISVTAVNGAGQSEPTFGYSDTRPGPPSNITNVRVNPERTSPTRLGFAWQPLNCSNVNGVFWYYYARIYKDGDRSKASDQRIYLDDDISYSSVEFNGLEACTMYELTINAVNGGMFTPGNLSHAIGVTGVTFTSASAYATGNQPGLRVYWRVPSQCNVDYYRVSYQLISREACQEVPVIYAPVYELNVTSSSAYVSKIISDLEYYATYSISIIAVIRRAESLPMNVSGDTRHGDPSAIESVSYTSTAHSFRFVWEEPSCESLHGALDGYEYELYDPTGGGRYVRYPTIIRRNYVLIHGLDACTEYRFRIRVVTTPLRRSEWHMEMAMTNISAPGMPVITELTPHQEDSGTTGLTVLWQPPFSPPCQPTHYEIKYYVIQGDMCENTPSDRMTSAGTVNGSTFTFNVLGLRPNSEFRVFVRGRTSSGYGDSDSHSATTGYSYPTSPPTNIQSASTKKRSIVFTWEKPECGNRNGPISSYEVMLLNYTGDVVYHGNVSAGAASTGYKILYLIPYSNYSIRIRAWNYELAGEYGPAIWAQTDEAKPAPPIGVNLPSSDQETITVEWMSPNPPLGRIIGYYILYWETDDNSSTPRNVSFLCQDEPCSDIYYKFSTVIPDLRPDTNYSVQVMAETIYGVGDPSPDPPVVRITSEGRPACVQALRVSSSITTVVVSWELSSSQCSPDYYIIRYSLLQKLACQSPETTPTEFEVNTTSTQLNNYNLVGLEPYSRYKITVTAVNGAGQSEPTIGYSDTRPGSPSNITNVRVNPERTSPTRLGFTWQPLNCRNVNGVFWYYFARIYKDGDRSRRPAEREYLDDDFSYSSVEFNGLEACTMYELSIHAGNRDVSTPGNVSNAIGVTGATFTSAFAYATGNQLRVQWGVPSQCHVDYYRLSYQLISRKACQDVPVIDAPVYELNVTSVSTDVSKYISNLEYYATYSISIIAVFWRTESLPINVSGDTLAGDPTGFPTNIRSTSTNKRSIVFTWETPDCDNRNGPISSYEVMLSNSTGDVVYHGNVSASAEPEHEIFELIPSSNYSIRIRAWNYELAGEYGPAIWVQTN